MLHVSYFKVSNRCLDEFVVCKLSALVLVFSSTVWNDEVPLELLEFKFGCKLLFYLRLNWGGEICVCSLHLRHSVKIRKGECGFWNYYTEKDISLWNLSSLPVFTKNKNKLFQEFVFVADLNVGFTVVKFASPSLFWNPKLLIFSVVVSIFFNK